MITKSRRDFAFVQCAGSRDENHLEYCSYICCNATIKQITYIQEQYPEAKVYVFYIDLRTSGRHEKLRDTVTAKGNVLFTKGKVAEIVPESDGSVTVVAENALTGEKIHQRVDMAVLAPGWSQTMKDQAAALGLPIDSNGFILSNPENGMVSCGCARKVTDVMVSGQNSTAAAFKAIQSSRR